MRQIRLVMVVLFASPFAAMVYSNPGMAGPIVLDNGDFNGVNGIASDPDFGQLIADDFVFSEDTVVAGMTFYGSYISDNIPGDDVGITFYENNGGRPGTKIVSFAFGDAVMRIDTGLDTFGSDLYAITVEFNPTLFLAGTSYWVSAFNDAQNSNRWAWGTADSPGAGRYSLAYTHNAGQNWSNRDGVELSFQLSGGVSPDAAEYGGVVFPAGAASFADRVIGYDPNFGGGPAPDETQQDSRQLLGVPGQGEMSLGKGGRVRLRFLDNSLTGSDDSQPDLYIFEVGGEEATYIDISKDGRRWFPVGTAAGFAFGIDIDQYGFDSNDRFSYVRITDDGDASGDFFLTPGADLVAVGARSSAPPVYKQPPINYFVQAHIGGRSELIIQGNKLQWHHIKGTAPGLERAFWNYGSNSNSPTIIDSNQGPNIPWVPSGWPGVIGNGTHPESLSSVFDALTPVFPGDGKCWKLEKLYGAGTTKIIQQPNALNDYSLVIEFDDLILGKRGGMYDLPGSGFYSIKLAPTYTKC